MSHTPRSVGWDFPELEEEFGPPASTGHAGVTETPSGKVMLVYTTKWQLWRISAVWIGKKDNFLFAKSTRTVASIRLFVAVFDAQRNFVESPTKTAVNAILERERERRR